MTALPLLPLCYANGRRGDLLFIHWANEWIEGASTYTHNLIRSRHHTGGGEEIRRLYMGKNKKYKYLLYWQTKVHNQGLLWNQSDNQPPFTQRQPARVWNVFKETGSGLLDLVRGILNVLFSRRFSVYTIRCIEKQTGQRVSKLFLVSAVDFLFCFIKEEK